MIVVDTNVIAYLHIPGVYSTAAAQLLEADSHWVAPVLWRSEFRNLLAAHLRRGTLSLTDVMDVQAQAEELLAGCEYETESAAVFELIAASDRSAYDCEFVALARRLRTRLVTMDKKLVRAFPERAVPLILA